MCVAGGRAFYSVARAGQLPSVAAKLNSKGMCACVYVCVYVCVCACGAGID
jgi:amino acid permease